VLVGWLGGPGAGRADATLIAVAASFGEAAEALVGLHAERSGGPITLSIGSTGSLYAQIRTGAPFAALLAADTRTPQRLATEGLAVGESRFVYAVGRLVLFSADPTRIGADGPAALRDPRTRHVALPNPALAPYGAAAREALERLGLWAVVEPRIVLGQNVAHAASLVASGAAEVGFVAASSLDAPGRVVAGSRWDVPRELHAPIRHEAVLLVRGGDDPTARAFLALLRSPEARRLIRRFGFEAE
jgi:molybdate transport system substrate-binding protein